MATWIKNKIPDKVLEPATYIFLIFVTSYIEQKIFLFNSNLLLLRVSLGFALGIIIFYRKNYFFLAGITLFLAHFITHKTSDAIFYGLADILFVFTYYLFSRQRKTIDSKSERSVVNVIILTSPGILSGLLVTLSFSRLFPIDILITIGYEISCVLGIIFILPLIRFTQDIDFLNFFQRPMLVTSSIAVLIGTTYLFYDNSNYPIWYYGLISLYIGFLICHFIGEKGIFFTLLGLGFVASLRKESLGPSETWIFLSGFLGLNLLVGYLNEIKLNLSEKKSNWFEEAKKLKNVHTDFLANISHELRTPLTAIIGYTDFLVERLERKKDLNEEYQKLISMKKSENSLLEMLNSIMMFSKNTLVPNIEWKNLEKEQLSVVNFFNDIFSAFLPLAEKKNLYLKLEFKYLAFENILIDKAALEQIVNNLINNAIKFTESGGITLTVDMKLDKPQTYLTFTVEDTGIGISQKNLQSIFTNFYQIESSMTRRFGGLGLGLAICSRLAHKLRGKIQVSSQEGHGSIFTLEVPAEDASLAKEAIKKNNKILKDLTSVEKKTVLVVDDSPDNSAIMSFFLQKLNVDIVMAENGKLAVDEALKKKDRFDLILMDMQMPVMDGYQATKILRQRGFKIPIIAVTAHTNPGDEEKCLEVGCSDYLSKPFSKAAFIEKVGHSLGDSIK